MRLTKGLVLAACIAALAGCAPQWPNKRLSAAERRACTMAGGYESRTPFGMPMCQMRYKDAGKPCKGTADCEGDCILYGGGDTERLPIGTATLGVCQPFEERFGEFAIVEDAKVASPWIISE